MSNGRIIGASNPTSLSSAIGIYGMNEMNEAILQNKWPVAYDPYWANVSSLMHFDGANNGTVFTDETGKTVTVFGNTKTLTADPKFGTASASFDGTGDYLEWGDNSGAFNLLGGDYTVEFFAKTTQSTANATFCSNTNAGFVAGEWTLLMNNVAGEISVFAASFSGGTPLLVTSGASINSGTRKHVAWVRFGNTHYIFVDGVIKASATSSFTHASTTKGLVVGKDRSFGRDYNGDMDEFRFTKGVARYTAAFTPPTFEFFNHA